jgi:hypothetical protein
MTDRGHRSEAAMSMRKLLALAAGFAAGVFPPELLAILMEPRPGTGSTPTRRTVQPYHGPPLRARQARHGRRIRRRRRARHG